MLILTRKISEKIMIGDDISLSILDIKGNQVRLGFDAPEHISIHRSEIYLKIQDELSGTSKVNSNIVKKGALEAGEYRGHMSH